MKKPKGKSCFVLASLREDLSVLRRSLDAHGIHILTPSDLVPGVDWGSEVRKQIDRADLVVGIFPKDSNSPWVIFELGVASARNKRLLVIAPPTGGDLPFALKHIQVLRIAVNNQEAIDFALDQIIAAPSISRLQPVLLGDNLPTLGDKTDTLIGVLEAALADKDYVRLESLAGEAIKLAGADVVVARRRDGRELDFAVWSDVLEPYVRNPLLVEVKGTIRRDTASSILSRMEHAVRNASGGWGLLLYGSGGLNGWDYSEEFPTILCLSLQELLLSLRKKSFPEVIRDLRNTRVHGGV